MDQRSPALIPVSSGLAVVMAEAPDETAIQESPAVPRMFAASLFDHKLQKLIATYSGLEATVPDLNWEQSRLV